jgi:hypothetical protein
MEEHIPDALPLTSLHLQFMPQGLGAECAVCRARRGEDERFWRECERCGIGFHEACDRAGVGRVYEHSGQDVVTIDVCPGCRS